MNLKLLYLVLLYAVFDTIILADGDDDDDEDEASNPGSTYGTDWVLFPDDIGNLHFVNMSTQAANSENADPNTKKVHFQLYTRSNPESYEELYINENDDEEDTTAEEENSSLFLGENALKVLSHGWLSSGSSPTVVNMKDAYLDSADVNVVIVDWRDYSQEISYVYSAAKTRYVGKQVGKLVRTLMKRYSMSGDMVHLVGHSLGAQIVGFAGRWLVERNMTVARVTGLDPARPLFEVPPADRIRADDADFVDIIHTNGGVLGVRKPHGDADFFPNGGTLQAGCAGHELEDACSHGRSHEYFTESIRTGGFVARKCGSWSSYKAGDCKDNESMNMGETCRNNARGKYYLYTNPSPPYSKDDSE